MLTSFDAKVMIELGFSFHDLEFLKADDSTMV